MVLDLEIKELEIHDLGAGGSMRLRSGAGCLGAAGPGDEGPGARGEGATAESPK